MDLLILLYLQHFGGLIQVKYNIFFKLFQDLVWNPDLYNGISAITIDEREENIKIWVPKLICISSLEDYYETKKTATFQIF